MALPFPPDEQSDTKASPMKIRVKSFTMMKVSGSDVNWN